MYDETEGLYKVWTLYSTYKNGISGAAGRDSIADKEYPTILGLLNAPTTFSLTDKPNTFFSYFTGDPSVYRDANTCYMAFDGAAHGNYPGTLNANGALGIAMSSDGGRSFMAIGRGGYLGSLIAPSETANHLDEYGYGQPAVAYAKGRWYMAYTDATINHASANITYLFSSTSPEFTGNIQKDSVEIGSALGAGRYVNSVSTNVGMTYNSNSNQLVIVCNATDGRVNATQGAINMSSFSIVNSSGGVMYLTTQTIRTDTGPDIRLAEQVAILTDSQGDLLNPSATSYTFAAAVYDSVGDYLTNPLTFVSAFLPST